MPTDYIDPQIAVTLDGLFRERVRRSPQAIAYRAFDRRRGAWVDFSWAETARTVDRWCAAFTGEGLSPGDRIGLLLPNGPEWVAADQAALGLGLVTVPLYLEDRAENAAFILREAGVRVLVVRDANLWRRVANEIAHLPALRRVVLLEGEAPTDSRIRTADQWLPATADPPSRPPGGASNLATIVYTSGTTGRPKGVMLSHANLLSNAHAALQLYPFSPDDLFLSLLPLSHAFERTAGYYLPMMAGATVAYARSVQQLAEDIRRLKPTVMIAVPRVFERVYARAQGETAKRSALARTLLDRTVATGWRRFEARQGQSRCGAACLAWPLLDRLVARRIRALLGGRLRLAVSGGAALPLPVARFFLGLGLDLVQGYGLTETSPVISVNLPENNHPTGVGLPLPGVEVRIGEDEELLVRGPGVMLGYWNNPGATAERIDADGWLHTGDCAHIDAGHIRITGRIKEILVLSNGEKVPPADLEMAIGLDPLFDHVIVFGEGLPFLGALVALNHEQWASLAADCKVDAEDPVALDAPEVQRHLLGSIRSALHAFPGYAKIRRVVPVLDEWSIESGLLTPTLKVKRARILSHYENRITAALGTGSRRLRQLSRA